MGDRACEQISVRLLPNEREASRVETAKGLLLDRYAPPSVVVNKNDGVQFYHGSLKNFLQFPSGEPTTNLLEMTVEGLRTSLRGALHKAITELQAHDFNNLLTIISGNLEILEEGIKDQASRDLIQRAESAARVGARALSDDSCCLVANASSIPNEIAAGMAEMLRRTLGEPYCSQIQVSSRSLDYAG